MARVNTGRKYIVLFSFMLIMVMIFCVLSRTPLFRLESSRFAEAPAILEALRPYLAKWATEPRELGEAERTRLGIHLNVSIEVRHRYAYSGQQIRFVMIFLEHWGNWSRGYLFVYDDLPDIEELEDITDSSLRPVEEGIYIFNLID